MPAMCYCRQEQSHSWTRLEQTNCPLGHQRHGRTPQQRGILEASCPLPETCCHGRQQGPDWRGPPQHLSGWHFCCLPQEPVSPSLHPHPSEMRLWHLHIFVGSMNGSCKAAVSTVVENKQDGLLDVPSAPTLTCAWGGRKEGDLGVMG